MVYDCGMSVGAFLSIFFVNVLPFVSNDFEHKWKKKCATNQSQAPIFSIVVSRKIIKAKKTLKHCHKT